MLLTTSSQQIFQSFLVIMVIAAIFAVALSYLATKRGGIKADHIAKSANREEFATSLAQAFSRLPLPQSERTKTAEAVIHAFDQEVQKQVGLKSQEIAHKFEKIVEEKEKTVQFVEKQYQVVSEKFENLNKNYRKLGTEKRQTEEIVRSMAEGVIMVNKKGEILLMNPAAEKLLGVNKEEKIGKPLLNDLREEQLVSLAHEITGQEEKEIVLQSKNDQTKKVLKASNAIIESEDGQTMGFVSVLSDVTKQRELDELKSAFVASVSHELRTPLHNVQESLSLLLDKVGGELNAQQEKILNIASNNIARLSRLINDLLDLSKIEARQFQLAPKTFRADELIRSITEAFDAWAKSKQITIESKISEPLEIEADPDRINQVLTNLTGNALKFTPTGGRVILELRKRQGEAAGTGAIEFSVQDTGPGIAKKDFQKIFEKFTQLNTPQLQGISGTGLGLAISKEIVELHGGRIWVESEQGKGSRFAFEIPQRNGAH